MNDTATAAANWGDALMDTYGTPPFEIVSGEGARVVDADGREYIDLLAGIAVNALGHGHPAVVRAVTEQVARLGHVSNLFASAPAVTLARRLIARVGDESARVFFCNSGAEANEAAFKLARLTGRRRVLAAHHGFHGRTMGSLALTGQPAKRAAFEPLAGGVEYYPYGDTGYLRALVDMDPSGVAAIFLEPIQGETGVVPAPDGFLRDVRALCDEHGILLVVDEVQTGAGRTGTFFAHEYEGIQPDVITMAKGLGGGLPIGATIARGDAARLFGPGSHGTTFGGNPVVCAAANAVLDVVDDAFMEGVAAKGRRFADRLRDVEGVAQVRGRGLMLAAVLDRPVAREMVTQGYRRGVIMNATSESVVRLTPPLVITEEDIDTATERIALTLAECTSTTHVEDQP